MKKPKTKDVPFVVVVACGGVSMVVVVLFLYMYRIREWVAIKGLINSQGDECLMYIDALSDMNSALAVPSYFDVLKRSDNSFRRKAQAKIVCALSNLVESGRVEGECGKLFEHIELDDLDIVIEAVVSAKVFKLECVALVGNRLIESPDDWLRRLGVAALTLRSQLSDADTRRLIDALSDSSSVVKQTAIVSLVWAFVRNVETMHSGKNIDELLRKLNRDLDADIGDMIGCVVATFNDYTTNKSLVHAKCSKFPLMIVSSGLRSGDIDCVRHCNVDVVVGWKYAVYRDKRFVGRIVVSEVDDWTIVCRVLYAIEGEWIRFGDLAEYSAE